jgi:hypothetical protein
LIVAVLRPIHIILLRPVARPLAWRLRGFFLIPVAEQMSALRHDLAELNSKFGLIVSTLQVLERNGGGAAQSMQRGSQPLQTEMVSALQALAGRVGDAEQGMRQSMQRLQTETEALRQSMQQVEEGEQRGHVQQLKADVESIGQSMQRLEGSTNDIRRDINNEISAMGRSMQAVLASLLVASERP